MTTVKTYQKKPVDIQAAEFIENDEASWAVLEAFTNHLVRQETLTDEDGAEEHREYYVFDRLHDTWVKFFDGDFIIKGTEGEFYPHNGELFKKNYKQVGMRSGIDQLPSVNGAGRP